MIISGGNSFNLSALLGGASMRDAKNAVRNALLSGGAQGQQSLDPSGIDMSAEIKSNPYAPDAAAENLMQNEIWARGRDWGMNEQYAITQEARDLAMRASNEATTTDSARAIMSKELDSLKAEKTRIGLTNHVHGHLTLAEFGEVQEVKTTTEVRKVTEIKETEVAAIQPNIDVLWVLDRTGSMSDDTAHIRDDAQKMFDTLKNKGFNVRMAAVSFEANLDNVGSKTFESDVTSFKADVEQILNYNGGGFERGLNAIEKAVDKFKGEFRQDATKVTVLITDEPSNDIPMNPSQQASYWNMDYGPNLSKVSVAEGMRQKAADALKSVGSELYAVGQGGPQMPNAKDPWVDTMPDEDYQDVVKKAGGGASINMDNQGKWVDEVTKNFFISAQNAAKKKLETTSEITVEKKEITTTYKLKDEWDLTFQVGQGGGDHITERFKTITAETSGLADADISTPENARAALTRIDKVIGFMNTAKVQVGTLETRFASMLDTNAVMAMNSKTNHFQVYSGAKSYADTRFLGAIASSYREKQTGYAGE